MIDWSPSKGKGAQASPVPNEASPLPTAHTQVQGRSDDVDGLESDGLVGGLESPSALVRQASEAVITSNASNAMPVGHSSADISMSARTSDSNASGPPTTQCQVVLHSDSPEAVAQDDPTSVLGEPQPVPSICPGTLAAIAPATDQETALVPFLDAGSLV